MSVETSGVNARATISASAGRKILIIEKSLLRRECLEHVLRSRAGDLDVQGVSDLDEVQYDPNLVVIFVEPFESENGELLAKVEEITRKFPDISIVGVADPHDFRVGIKALRLGLKGCVLTSQHIEVAIAAIRLVLAGGSYLPSELIGPICNNFDFTADSLALTEHGDRLSYSVLSDHISTKGGHPVSPDLGLTGRENEIIEQLRQGKPNKIIAYELRISEGTVKVHMRNIMRKLKATNRTQVAYLAGPVTAPHALPSPTDRSSEHVSHLV